jgi:hypothetical protein
LKTCYVVWFPSEKADIQVSSYNELHFYTLY